MGVEPTKLTACTAGCSNNVSTASLSPCTTLNTPLGKPASASKRAMNNAALGSRSLGLSTKVLPATSANGNIQQGTMQGKLNGVIPATTPKGSRVIQLSSPVATCCEKPLFSN